MKQVVLNSVFQERLAMTHFFCYGRDVTSERDDMSNMLASLGIYLALSTVLQERLTASLKKCNGSLMVTK